MKKFENKLSNESLDMVAGGTLKQTREILAAFVDLGNTGKNLVNISASLAPDIAADVAGRLLKGIGINAFISVGFYGIGSEKNIYQDAHTGEILSHRKVINRIKHSHIG